MFKYLENLVNWARYKNSLITYAQLNVQIVESIESQEEIENFVSYLMNNNISLFESMPGNIEQESILKNKIENAFEDIEPKDIKDKDRLYSISRYYNVYDNRILDFLLCSSKK